jgi:hypothetical protein
MKENKTTAEFTLYWLAFLLALGLRLYQLGAGALSEAEAAWAQQALDLSRGVAGSLGPQPLYILFTSLLFTLIKDSNFIARFIPALLGSLIIWLPLCFRRRMGDSVWLHRAGVVMAFGLALDPGLVSLSRQAGSLMPALALTLFALASFYNRRMVLAGICAGLALLSGPAFLQGVLILAISWGLYTVFAKTMVVTESDSGGDDAAAEVVPAPSIRAGVIAFLLTLLFAGTLFLRHPQGLGALADAIPAYIKSWVTASGVPILRLPASLLVYQLIVVIFAVVGALRAWLGRWEDHQARLLMVGLSIWAAIASLLPLLSAGRQVGDLAWALIPLWALASLEISRAFLAEEDVNTRLVGGGLGLLLCIFAVISWFNLLAIGRYSGDVRIYWAIIIGAFLLGLVAVILVLVGWSAEGAKLGVIWSLCILLGLFLIANTWGMTIVRQNGAQEMWSVAPTAGQADQFLATLSDFSSWNTGLRDQLEVVALADSSALRWALRDYPNASFETALSPTESPPVVVTLKGSDEPSLAQKYRGQDFVWNRYPGWQGVFPPEFINWLAFRKAPLSEEQIILWARTDIFPGGVAEPAGNAVP